MTGHGPHVPVTKALSWGKEANSPSTASVLFWCAQKSAKRGRSGKSQGLPGYGMASGDR